MTYKPRVCFKCEGAGCTRCQGSGFTIGPRSTPVPLTDLGPAEANWHYLKGSK